jgi:ATP-dependent helicase HrpA
VVFPGSALAKKAAGRPHERRARRDEPAFARTNGAIDPAWAEQLAGPLAKRTYREPRWERRQGSAVADEKVTLFGVPIVAKRRIQLGRVDQVLARELFIRHALVEEDWDTSEPRSAACSRSCGEPALRRELGEVEERTRRRDILAGDEASWRSTRRGFRGMSRTRVRSSAGGAASTARRPDLLTMTRADLLWLRGRGRSRRRIPRPLAAGRPDVLARVPLRAWRGGRRS